MKLSETKFERPYDLCGAIAELGMSRAGFARRLKALGDSRREEDILSAVKLMIAGEAHVPGELRALIGLMREVKAREGLRLD